MGKHHSKNKKISKGSQTTKTDKEQKQGVNWKRVGGVTGGVLGAGVVGYGMSQLGGGSSNGSGGGSGKGEGTGTGGEGSSDGSGDGSSGSGGSGDSNTTVKTKVIEVPIDNYKEAMEFATREWNKIKRDNGRTIECQVQGSCNWRVGEWCKVYLPSFDIDGFMYITRVSQSSEGGDWTCNLSLVDYPPGWGKEEIEENTDEESEDGSGDDSSDSSSGDDSSDGSSEDSSSSSSGNSGGQVDVDGQTYNDPNGYAS